MATNAPTETEASSLVEDPLAYEPLAGVVAGTVIAFNIDEAKEAIVARGRERGGFVTSEDLLEGFPVEDLTPEQLEEFLTQVEDHLRQELRNSTLRRAGWAPCFHPADAECRHLEHSGRAQRG